MPFLIYSYNIQISLKSNPINIEYLSTHFKACHQCFSAQRNSVKVMFKHHCLALSSRFFIQSCVATSFFLGLIITTQEVAVGSYSPIFTFLTKYRKVVQVVENVFDILKRIFSTWKWFVKLLTSSPIINTCHCPSLQKEFMSAIER